MTGSSHASYTELLPANALTGVRVGISVSNSPHLARLGLLEIHFRLALGEIARCVVVSGGNLSYGGHLDSSGYTVFLIKELQRFHRRDRPLLVTLALSEHWALTQQELQDCQRDMGLFGSLECLDENGNVISSPRTEGRIVRSESPDTEISARALTAMRKHLANRCDARILLGGRHTGYEGYIPGLIEEAIETLKHNKPLFLAGGFGGVTLDIVKVLGVADTSWFPGMQNGASDSRMSQGLKELSEIASHINWNPTDNGLTIEENKKLASTHRPSEIAALVSLGLGRKFHQNSRN
jgi:hypothetical protein